MGAHLSRPHDERSRQAEAGGVRRRDDRQLGRRDAHDDLRDRRVAEERQRDLGRHRRRQPAGHARRREELDECRGEHPGAPEERVGVIRGGWASGRWNGLRHFRSAHRRRHATVRVPVHRLRAHLDATRSRRRLRARLRTRREGRSGRSRPSLPRNRVRALDLAGWRCALGTLQGGRLPHRGGARPRDPSARPRSRDRHARARHLDRGRHLATPRAHVSSAGQRRGVHEGASHGGKALRRRRVGQRRRGVRRAESAERCGDHLLPEEAPHLRRHEDRGARLHRARDRHGAERQAARIEPRHLVDAPQGAHGAAGRERRVRRGRRSARAPRHLHGADDQGHDRVHHDAPHSRGPARHAHRGRPQGAIRPVSTSRRDARRHERRTAAHQRRAPRARRAERATAGS